MVMLFIYFIEEVAGGAGGPRALGAIDADIFQRGVRSAVAFLPVPASAWAGGWRVRPCGLAAAGECRSRLCASYNTRRCGWSCFLFILLLALCICICIPTNRHYYLDIYVFSMLSYTLLFAYSLEYKYKYKVPAIK